MHELSIAKRVVDLAIETARKHNARDIDGLTLAVGRATHLNPDQLRFCIQTIADGTPAADATVTIETVAPRAECDCGWTGEPAAVDTAVSYVPDPTCPDCGDRVELTHGRGCRLASIDVPSTTESTANTSIHSE